MSDSSPSAEDFTGSNVVNLSPHSLGGAQTRGPITGGGGGSGMSDSERIAKLETHFEYIRKDLDEIKSDQKVLLSKANDLVNSVATKNDVREWKWTWTAIALAAVAVIVGGIIGGLSWIKHETAPQIVPMHIQPQTDSNAD
jgi:hypothetical protein